MTSYKEMVQDLYLKKAALTKQYREQLAELDAAIVLFRKLAGEIEADELARQGLAPQPTARAQEKRE